MNKEEYIWFKNGKESTRSTDPEGKQPFYIDLGNGKRIDYEYENQKIYKTTYTLNGKKHRDGDKPAIETASGNKVWYKNGKQHRDGDKPAIEYAYGHKLWYQYGKRHRDGDKPAVEYADGHKEWYKNGKTHRDGDKPAVEYANGHKEWFKNGKAYIPRKN